MRVDTTVYLSVSDSCRFHQPPFQIGYALLGTHDHGRHAFALRPNADPNAEVVDKIQLLEIVDPPVELVGWIYLGYGSDPSAIDVPTTGSYLILIDLTMNTLRAFRRRPASESWEIENLEAVSEPAARIALRSVLRKADVSDEERARQIYRDKVKAIASDLDSSDPNLSALAIKKICQLRRLDNLKRADDDSALLLYELLAEVVSRADKRIADKY